MVPMVSPAAKTNPAVIGLKIVPKPSSLKKGIQELTILGNEKKVLSMAFF